MVVVVVAVMVVEVVVYTWCSSGWVKTKDDTDRLG